LRDDKEVVMTALTSKDSWAASIQDAGPLMKNDIDVAEAALRNYYADIHHLGEEPRKPKYRDRMFKAYKESKHGGHVPDRFTSEEYFECYIRTGEDRNKWVEEWKAKREKSIDK